MILIGRSGKAAVAGTARHAPPSAKAMVSSDLRVLCMFRSLGLSVAELAPQVAHFQRLHVCALFVVGRATVATLDVLEVQHLLRQRKQPRRHLAGMAGMHPVVTCRCGEQHLRVRHAGAKVLVRAVLRDVLPLFGLVGVAVLGHPRRAGQQGVIALHVEQRHAADHSIEQVGALRERRADQETAVAPTFDPEVLRAGDAALDQVECDRDEIVVAALLVFFYGGLVPGRAELAAAADGEELLELISRGFQFLAALSGVRRGADSPPPREPAPPASEKSTRESARRFPSRSVATNVK